MLIYRPANKQDIAAICALGEEVNALHFSADSKVFAGPGKPDAHSAHWLRSIEQENETTFLAEEESSALGFVTVSVSNESHSLLQPICYGRIGTLGVTKSARGRGIGKHLMQLAQDWANQRGAVETRLNVGDFNSNAIALYKTLGYEVRSLAMVRTAKSAA
jgi:ribosomal protein S18 acetylase RimI-like enzyme